LVFSFFNDNSSDKFIRILISTLQTVFGFLKIHCELHKKNKKKNHVDMKVIFADTRST